MSKRILFFIAMVLILGVLLASCGSTNASATSTPAATTSSSESSTGSSLDGQALMQERCTVCHSVSRIESAHKTSDQWKTTVDRMISNGAQLTPQEEQVLVDYLAQTYK